MARLLLLLVALVRSSDALAPPQPSLARSQQATFDPLRLSTTTTPTTTVTTTTTTTAAIVVALALPEPAVAKGGEYGLAEGRIISMVHPTAMMSCFFVTLLAGYTGVQWRRLREVGAELQAAKKAAKATDPQEEDVLPTVDPLVESLQAQLKTLRDGNFRDVHFFLGSILLAVGIPLAVEGPVNTFMRAGKLFPGPHLYAGAAVVSLWALAAALVPEMQKGKDWARSLHIGLNALNLAFIAYYQIPTGLEITAKVLEKTNFP